MSEAAKLIVALESQVGRLRRARIETTAIRGGTISTGAIERLTRTYEDISSTVEALEEQGLLTRLKLAAERDNI